MCVAQTCKRRRRQLRGRKPPRGDKRGPVLLSAVGGKQPKKGKK